MIRYLPTKMRPLCALALGAASCLGPGDITGDETEVALVGTVNVATLTTGSAIDIDGYVAFLNEGLSQPIDVNGSVTFGGVPVGTHDVRLMGMDDTCVVVSPNPVYVLLLPDSTVTTEFEVNCP